MLFVLEGQKSGAWEHSNQAVLFRISGSMKQESIFKLLVPKQEFGVRWKELVQRVWLDAIERRRLAEA